MSRDLLSSIEQEYRRYKALGEGAFEQLDDAHLGGRPDGHDNSVATIVWHVSGNLESRFTDFLSADGEKPWRDRDSEFAAREVGKDELRTKWERGWSVLFDSLAQLGDDDLHRSVAIRGVSLRVHEALHRSLAHVAYHVGQIVYLAKKMRGAEWSFLSIPPGGSAEYNRNPQYEKGPPGPAHPARP